MGESEPVALAVPLPGQLLHAGVLGPARPSGLNLLILRGEATNAISPSGWEEIEMAVNSGATKKVFGGDMLPSIPNSTPPRKGLCYETADGTDKPHVGAKKFGTEMESGMTRGREAQAQIAEGLKSLIVEWGVTVSPPILLVDNRSALTVAENGGTWRTRYFAVREARLQQEHHHGRVVLRYCPTDDMACDR